MFFRMYYQFKMVHFLFIKEETHILIQTKAKWVSNTNIIDDYDRTSQNPFQYELGGETFCLFVHCKFV